MDMPGDANYGANLAAEIGNQVPRNYLDDAVERILTELFKSNLMTTRFSSGTAQAPGQDLIINMGSARAFSELDMEVPNSAGDYASGYRVQVSADGTNWTSVATCTGTSGSEIVSFPAQTDQYVKVALTQAVSPNWWSVDELYLRV